MTTVKDGERGADAHGGDGFRRQGDVVTRRAALAAAALAGAGVVAPGHATALGRVARPPADAIQDILDTALMGERLAITFYYTALTTPAVMHDPRLGGPSADPNHPGSPPGGNPANVKTLQAALDAEVKHAAALVAAGGRSPSVRFYFPVGTFDALGSPARPNTVLGRLDILETAFVGAYAAAARQFMLLGRPDLASVVARIMGVEAEHRALGRLIVGVDPVRPLKPELTPIGTVADAARALDPFLTGRPGEGFAGRPMGPIPLPTATQTARVIGRYQTRIVRNFLSGEAHG